MTTLGVDLGKTGCRVALWHAGGRHDAQGRGAPGLAELGGVAQAEVAILSIAAPLMRGAGLGRVDAVGVGAAGAWTAPDAARDLARRLALRLPAETVSIASDALAAHAGALGGQPGVVLTAGTGAVAVTVGPDGQAHRVDGLGPLLGDDGGGSAIGRAGLRAAMRASERRGPPTRLSARAEAIFGPLAALPARLGADPNPARTLAAFAPEVAGAAEAGDAIAAAIMATAADALLATVRAARERLPAGVPFPFALIGGLSHLGDALTGALFAALPGLQLTPVVPAGSALDGARHLATAGGLVQRVRADGAGDPADLLSTEAVRPGLEDLDQRAPGAIVALALDAERAAQAALDAAAPALGALADAVAGRMRAGGRLFYLGAGTPGRLATLDAAELAPTYSAPPGLVIPLLAGGPGAMVEAVEGAEDDEAAAARALDAHGLHAGDAVVGIAASGRTPFVVAGLRHARARGALTGAIVNNGASPAADAADIAVEILTGPELVAGSTRMSAGTTQKIALNALSTACMISLGKTFGARMVDVRATNAKLRRRALRIVREVASCTEARAAAALEAAGFRVKPALLMIMAGVDAAEADRRLLLAHGHLRRALEP